MSSLLDSFDQVASAVGSGAPKKKSLTEAFDAAAGAPAAAPADAAAASKHWWQATLTPEQQAQYDHDKSATDGAGAGLLQAGAHAVTSAGSSLYGLTRSLGALAAGGSLNDAVNEITDAQRDYTYQPPEGSAGARLLGAAAVPLSYLAKGTQGLGDATLERTGSPVLATLADVGTNTAATMGAGKLLGGALKARPAEVPAAPRVEPTMSSPAAAPAPLAVAPGAPAPNLTLEPQAPVPARAQGFPGADGPAAAVAPPVAAAVVPRQAANAPTISDAPNGVFAEANPDVAGGLPEHEQARRAAVLQAIGLDRVRNSAVTGDSAAASTDFQTSRIDSPAGKEMRSAIDGEKAALSNYADGIVQDTGGSSMNDQNAKLARGNTIVAPLDAMKDYFDTQTRDLYKVADERAQGVPTQLGGFRTVLGDDSLATNSDRINLRSAIGSYAKKLGIVDDQGNVFANAQQAETMRKYLNENWSPQNSGLVGKLKDALDDDVMKAAGEDVYGQARAMRAQRAATLDNPDGIAKLMDTTGPINRKVPIERIADTVTTMPVAQLNHIVQTLREAPPEIQPQAQAALAEIKAQFAHNVAEIGMKQAGQWNAKGVRQYLSNNSARMAQVFGADEMQHFGTLNDAGNILAKDQSYPGAAVQQHNLVRAGVAHGLTTGMAAVGGAVGGAPGAALGSIVGGKMAGKFNDAASLRATQKRMTRLSDLATDAGEE